MTVVWLYPKDMYIRKAMQKFMTDERRGIVASHRLVVEDKVEAGLIECNRFERLDSPVEIFTATRLPSADTPKAS